MKESIYYIDRKSGKRKVEKVYGDYALGFLYGKTRLGKFLAYLSAKIPLFSAIYGSLQRLPRSKKKILPFIRKFEVNTEEFLIPTEKFLSFDDFFTRQLKPNARPIDNEKKNAIIPADGRYLFYQYIDQCDGFIVKGKKFSLNTLLEDEEKAERYSEGSMVLGRLCPSDYHRFHFPLDCIPGPALRIHGPLYSVNPIAVKQNLKFLISNKRMITELKSDLFGTVQYIEIGATNVGSIHQTYQPDHPYQKGDEKGFFSFGGSSIILLFEPSKIQFDEDLLKASSEHMEILCLLGQSMGKAVNTIV